MNADSSSPSTSRAHSRARGTGLARTLRSGMFFFVYAIFTLTIFDLGQRLIIWPAVWLFPLKRRAIVRRWLRFLAKISLWISRVFGGVRVSINGTAPTESCLLVMNHQSLLDITISVNAARGPQAVIPTRERYGHGIPGISSLTKLGRFPLVTQQPRPSKAEVAALLQAARDLSNGETTLIIYPEGHRTTDGNLLPFMRSGLRLLLQRSQRPVYYIVSDGLWHARNVKEAIHSFANSNVSVVIRGPLSPPNKENVDAFIDDLHARMSDTLAEIRHPLSPPPQPAAGELEASPAR
jgi:1-acyl-sn-glycerol-3-phosphate acyltransferase